ncbi:4'-phosphopantetheinyl transferase [Alteromonas sediminis]|uniref:4'-phosphopantetheinyl transferase n=1 Tax=Alteromonas sediminis TaxID=2259342 RepID=A0A3N5ZDK0_9ALTE|nr:restriction endonuclease subunit S [Alteromonas sediminis]RPJ68208.1 4'-phosphopantetheinyl transferase [Alteromonas sediminis]
MSQLPQGWTVATISQITNGGLLSDGDWVESKDQDSNGVIRLIQLADIGDGFFKNKSQRFMNHEKAELLRCTFLKEGDVLIARMPDPLGRASIFPKLDSQSVTVVDVCIARVNDDSILNNRLLKYWINSPEIRQQIQMQATGTTRRRITKKKLSLLELPIPPKQDQKHIADKLDSLLAKVEAAQARLDKIPTILKRFRQSVLAAATSGELTKDWREENDVESAANLLAQFSEERKKLLDAEIADGNRETKRLISKIKKHNPLLPDAGLPAGWVWTSFMSSMVKVVDCHNKTAPYIDTGIPLIRTTDIRNGVISLEGAKYISQETYDYWSRRCPPEPGDIIFTREAPMGEAGIVPEAVQLCMGQRMMLLRPDPRYVSPDYLVFNTLSFDFKERMNGQAIGTGVKHLRVADVEALTYPLPPYEEQLEIVERVTELFEHANTVEKQYNAAKARLDKLTQSILAKAFRGELTKQ